MSRTTQYIGLTQRARDLTGRLERLDSDTHTTGMFEEKIDLGKWKADGECLVEGVVREVVQWTPWSSGMMIFTCLEWEMSNGEKVTFDQWIMDPCCDMEYDVAEGVLWV